MKPMHLTVLTIVLFSLLFLAEANNSSNSNTSKSDQQNQKQQQNDKLRAQSRNGDTTQQQSASTRKPSTDNKAIVDMHSVYQQHLIGPNVAQAVAPHDNKNEKKDLWSRFGQSKEASAQNGEGGKKGRLQTVGSVIGDIIGVLVSEIARFFGSVVSDVAREVTAHGFVSLFKQIADFTGISFGSGTHNAQHHTTNSIPVHH